MRYKLSLLALLSGLQVSTGVWLTPQANARMQSNVNAFSAPAPIQPEDVERLNTRVRAAGGDATQLLSSVKQAGVCVHACARVCVCLPSHVQWCFHHRARLASPHVMLLTAGACPAEAMASDSSAVSTASAYADLAQSIFGPQSSEVRLRLWTPAPCAANVDVAPGRAPWCLTCFIASFLLVVHPGRSSCSVQLEDHV